ncbi:uncharacterized protein LOC124154369 [Ischnura elegans]|uniref:uncharacterized protein LOC124154369 n=1 Tax=Ischnura elegans TaxID=197161 RepID=UPI001ED86B8F|nr:uncharacterized protein LOC124154369 [Ischnura elegans]
MAPTIHLIIIGAILVIPTLILATPTEEPDISDATFIDYIECSRRANKRKEIMKECISLEFTEEKINATLALHNETEYIKSKHACRKQDEILQCIREAGDDLKSFSNQSVVMVPFVSGMSEESIRALCDNDAELLNVLMNETQGHCSSIVAIQCEPKLAGADDFDNFEICDNPIPQPVDLDQKYICQKFLDFMECLEANIDRCSEEMKEAVTRIIFKWKHETTCSNYLDNVPEN